MARSARVRRRGRVVRRRALYLLFGQFGDEPLPSTSPSDQNTGMSERRSSKRVSSPSMPASAYQHFNDGIATAWHRNRRSFPRDEAPTGPR